MNLLIKKLLIEIGHKTYFIPVIFMGLTPVVWFLGRGGVLINGVDTNFPLDPSAWFLRRFFVWNSIGNAGSDFASSTAGLFFHLIQFIPYKLGLSLQTTEIISLVFWFLLIVISAYTLARAIIPKFYLGQLLVVTLYAFNIYLFNSWENVKVANLSLVAALPLGLAILLLLRSNKIDRKNTLLFSAVTGIILSGSGINPAYFVCFLGVMLLYVFAEVIFNPTFERFTFILKNFLNLILPIILVNLFWIIPTLYFIITKVSSSDSITSLGFNNWIDSLSQNTSIINILRLQGAWDWYAFDSSTGMPLYIPYALNYFYKLPFIVFSLLVPTLVLCSLIIRVKNKGNLYMFFCLILFLGIFLGVGTYLPTGTIYRWMINHIPFFTLFRSPWYIFTSLVTLSYACLAGLLFYRLTKISLIKFNFFFRGALQIIILAIIVANLIYTYPLVSGKIFRPGREDSFYIKFPDYVLESGKLLNQEKEGRVIGYPGDEIENFTWYYRGIESILQLLADKEVLFVPLNASDSEIASLIKEFYHSLSKGDISLAKSIAGKLNIRTIFEKKDQKSLAEALPAAVLEFPRKDIGNWSFYRLPEDSYLPKIFSTNSLFYVYPYKSSERAVSVLNSADLVLNPKDAVISTLSEISNTSGTLVSADNSQVKIYNLFKQSKSRLSNRLISRDLSNVNFSFNIPIDGAYQPLLEKYHLDDFGIDLSKNLAVELDGKTITWELLSATDTYLYFKPINIFAGNHTVSIKLINTNLIGGGSFDKGETFRKGGEGKEESLFQIDDDGKEKYLSILNIGKSDISADFDVTQFDPLVNYYVEVKYKQIYGNNGGVLASQSKKDVLFKAEHERVPNYPEWRTFSFFYNPVEVNSNMIISLTSPYVNDPLGTKILYKDLKVYKVFSNDLLFINKNQHSDLIVPEIRFEKKSPVLYTGEVNGADNPHLIVFSENYSPDWELSIYDLNNRKIETPSYHFSANYYANSWLVKSTPQNYKFKLYYKPQNFFNIGIIISLGSLLIFIGIFLLRKKSLK